MINRLIKPFFATALLCLAGIMANNASAQIFPTAPRYDEPTQTNRVDYVASGSTLDIGLFKSSLLTAFTNNYGGVWQCKVVGYSGGPYTLSYGISHTKQLIMSGVGNEIGVTA